MAPLNFNAYAYAFQRGLDTLENSFRASVKALNEEAARCCRDLTDWHDRDSAQLATGIECASEEEADFLNIELASAEEGLDALCKAFVISLYHHWERSTRRYAGAPNKADHSIIVRSLLSKGVAVAPEMEAVRCLVNTMKHGSDRWGNEAVKLWPDAFPPNFSPLPGQADWYSSVSLHEAEVYRIAEILRASGPNRPTFRFTV